MPFSTLRSYVIAYDSSQQYFKPVYWSNDSTDLWMHIELRFKYCQSMLDTIVAWQKIIVPEIVKLLYMQYNM
jgi:hypothetical protein